MPQPIRPATPADLSAVTRIYDHAVRQGTASFEIEPPDETEMARRYRALLAAAEAKSPGEVTTGLQSGESQIPPPRPPALEAPVTSLTSSLARSACEPHRTWIEGQVRLKRNAQAIYQDLVDRFGFPSSYQSVKRFVRTLRHGADLAIELAPEAEA